VTIKLFPEAIARRREENGGCDRLSDWQVHSLMSQLERSTLWRVGSEAGPLYVPIQTVRSPRCRRPSLYSDQLVTRCFCFGILSRRSALNCAAYTASSRE
jgi:hypothetical protein